MPTDKEIDKLFELLAKMSPRPPELPTIEIPLDKPVEFRDGEEKTATATLTVSAR